MSDRIPKTVDSMSKEDSPGLFVKIPRNDFNIIMRQHLASKNLYTYLQEVARENKRLLQRNETLEKAILRTGKQISEMVVTRSQQHEFQEFSSLPSCLQASHMQKEMNELLDTVRGKSDCSDQGNMPLHLVHSRNGTQTAQVFFPSSMRLEEEERNDDEHQIPPAAAASECAPALDTLSANATVSRQYFDIIVKELAKSKRFIQQQLAKNGEKPKDVMNVVYLKEMVQSLEDKNSRLQESNHQLQTLLESKNQEQNLMRMHEKVWKLERQLQLKEKALEELNRQCDSLKTSAHSHSSTTPTQSESFKTAVPPDYFVQLANSSVTKHDKNSSNQADSLKSSLNSVSVQTDDLTNSQSGGDQHEVSKQAERSDGVHSRTAELEAMVASLTTAISEGDRKCETLLEKNRMLERNHKQLLQSMIEIDEGHNALQWKEEKITLMRNLERAQRSLTEKSEDARYSQEKIQSLQHDIGKLSRHKSTLEATLQKEREDFKKQESQYLKQIQAIQAQFEQVLEEKNRLQTSMAVSRPLPYQREPQAGPMSLGGVCRPRNRPWHPAHSEVSLVADSDESFIPPSEDDGSAENMVKHEFVCQHCQRTDFATEESFQQHLQRCGD